jgi:hypothetical protein
MFGLIKMKFLDDSIFISIEIALCHTSFMATLPDIPCSKRKGPLLEVQTNTTIINPNPCANNFNIFQRHMIKTNNDIQSNPFLSKST